MIRMGYEMEDGISEMESQGPWGPNCSRGIRALWVPPSFTTPSHFPFVTTAPCAPAAEAVRGAMGQAPDGPGPSHAHRSGHDRRMDVKAGETLA